jgi:membrane associated rhomboid family serine protease
MLSCFFCLVGIVGISSVSWKYAHDYDWLFHELYRPMASGGLFGVLSTIVNVYTAHDGTVHPASIVTLVVMSLITVIFSWLALNSYHHL